MSAVISPCELFRYRLDRVVADRPGMVAFVMLNPSTADAEQDDPTIRRCKGFALDWGFGRLIVVNLFAYRTTDPDDLRDAAEAGINIVGPENGSHILAVRNEVSLMVAAWGAHHAVVMAPAMTMLLVNRHAGGPSVMALGLTKGGAPRHPLYVRRDARPINWPPPGGLTRPGYRATPPGVSP